MADVTATFAAKDQGVAAMIQRLENKLTGFQSRMISVSASAKRMQGSFSNLGRSIVGLGAAYLGVSQVISAFNKALDFGGKMNDMAVITGESAGNLAVLERAFNNTGVGGEKMMPMIAKMTEFMQQLEKGQASAVATANKLGLSFSDLKNKTPIERFQMLLRAVAALRTENEQLTAAQDVFGTRIGGRLIPLINNFSGEMQQASAQLGTMVEILNRNAAGIDDFADRIQNAIAAKPMEFVIGLLDQMTGRTKNLAKSIAEIDAAKLGQQFAKLMQGVFDSPKQAFVAMGETLLIGVMKAGNMLVDAAVHAGSVWQKYLTDPGAQRNFFSAFGSGFQMIFNWGNRLFYSTFKSVLQMLDKITFGNWPFAKETIAGLEELQKQFDAQAAAIQQDITKALGVGATNFADIAKSVPKQELNTFNVDRQKQEADAAWKSVMPSRADEFFQAINQGYRDNVESIYATTKDAAERMMKIDALKNKYREEAAKGIRAFGEPSAAYAPPQAQLQQSVMPQSLREDMARKSSQSLAPSEEVASEPTLQKAVSLLESLNTKLPQPVLV